MSSMSSWSLTKIMGRRNNKTVNTRSPLRMIQKNKNRKKSMMRLLQRSFVATPWVLSSSSVDNAFLLSFLSFKPPHSHSTRDNRGTPATLSCVLWSRFSACSSAIQNLKQSVFEIMIGRDHKIQTKLEAKDLKLTALHCGHFFRLGRQSLQINWFEKGHLSSTENYLHTRVLPEYLQMGPVLATS